MSTKPDHHPDDEQLERYAMGASRVDEEAEVEEHLLLCERCRQRATEAGVYAASMKGAAGEYSRQEHTAVAKSGWFPKLIPVFALAALALVAVGVVALQPRLRAPVAVTLAAVRGSDTPQRAPSGRPLDLRLDLTGLPPSGSYRLEMVNEQGNSVWKGNAAPSGNITAVSLPAQPTGVYFVRIYLPTGPLLREYSLEIRDAG